MCLFKPERSDGQNSLKPLTDAQNSWLSLIATAISRYKSFVSGSRRKIIKFYTQFTNRDDES